MSSYSLELLQEKLSRLNSTQESIETLSLWIIRHKEYASTSVSTWMEDMRTGNADRRLLLLYLANDVLQNGKRKGADVFRELFQDPMRESMQLISGQKIQTSVERMVRIWKERKIFPMNFLSELSSLLEPEKKIEMPSSPPKIFQLSLLADAVKEMEKFEGELAVKRAGLQALRLNVSDPNTLMQLKDKSAGGRFSEEFEEASQKLQEYCSMLNIEADERTSILEMVVECMNEQKQFYMKVHTVYEEHKQLSNHIEEFLNKLHERQRELERAQSTSTSDPLAKEDITEEGDMEIDSGDESASHSRTVAATTATTTTTTAAKPQQLSQEQLNTMAQTLQIFPNLLPAIQQLQQPHQQIQRNPLVMPNLPLQTSNYLSLLPTPAPAAVVRPGFTPVNISQRTNMPPLLPHTLPAIPPPIASLNISQQLPPPRMAVQGSNQYQQRVGPPSVGPLSVNQQFNALPSSMNSVQLNSLLPHQQQQQTHVLYRSNKQQPVGAFSSTAPQQPVNQQQVRSIPSAPPIGNQQGFPAPNRNTVMLSQSAFSHPAVNAFTTSSTDNTPLFLKAARANAVLNIAPPVTHPKLTTAVQPSQPLPLPQMLVAPSCATNTALLNPPSSQSSVDSLAITSVLMNAVQSPAPVTVQSAQLKPIVAPCTEAIHTSLSTFTTTTVSTSASNTTTSSEAADSESALALASSLVPGLDTEVLQSILRTVKVGSGNISTSSDNAVPVSIGNSLPSDTKSLDIQSETVDAKTLTTFEADDVHVDDPNIFMFGERKRRPSDKESVSLLEEPDPKLAKVDASPAKTTVPPWLQEWDGTAVNGPVSCSEDDNKKSTEGSKLSVSKDPPPIRPYFRDLGFDHGPPMRSQQPSFENKGGSYSLNDHDYGDLGPVFKPNDGPFEHQGSFVRDYGHGQVVPSMDYQHGKNIHESSIENQGLEKEEEYGSESPGTDTGLFIKDQESDVESPTEDQKSVQEPSSKDLVPNQQGPLEGTQKPAPKLPVSGQGLPKLTVSGQGPPMEDHSPSYGPPPVIDQKPSSQGLSIVDLIFKHTDQRTLNRGHEPLINDSRHGQGPHVGDQGLINKDQEFTTNQEGIPTQNQRFVRNQSLFANQAPGQGPPIRHQVFPYQDEELPARNQGFVGGQGISQRQSVIDQGYLIREQIPPVENQGPPVRDHGPPVRDHGPPVRDQGPPVRDHGPPVRDHGPPFRDHGPPVRDHGPPPFRDHGPPFRDHGPPPFRDHGPHFRDHGPHFRDFGPHFRDHGPPFRDHGPPLRDHGPTFRDRGLHVRDHGPPIRDQEQLVRNQGPLNRDHGPPNIDQRIGQGQPVGRPTAERPPASDQGPPASDQGPPTIDQGLPTTDQGPTQGRQEEIQGHPPVSERKPNQGPPNMNQEPGQEPVVKDQEHSGSDQDRDHGTMRPNSEHYSQIPPPDHFDRPIPDKYYRHDDRPPSWGPPMRPRRMSPPHLPPPPFRHHPPWDMRFPPPPPRDAQWQHRQDNNTPPHSQCAPPHHHHGHGPPRLPPYRQPYQ